MILCDIFSGDGVEGLWFFASAPREGEYVMLRDFGSYRVTRVVHWPTNLEIENVETYDRRASMKIYVTNDGVFGDHPPGWHGDSGASNQTPFPET